jgi:hypothetical protein
MSEMGVTSRSSSVGNIRHRRAFVTVNLQPATELAAALERQERSARWLARKTRVDPSLVHRILTGERRPSDTFKQNAAEALGIPVDDLFPAPDVTA